MTNTTKTKPRKAANAPRGKLKAGPEKILEAVFEVGFESLVPSKAATKIATAIFGALLGLLFGGGGGKDDSGEKILAELAKIEDMVRAALAEIEELREFNHQELYNSFQQQVNFLQNRAVDILLRVRRSTARENAGREELIGWILELINPVLAPANGLFAPANATWFAATGMDFPIQKFGVARPATAGGFLRIHSDYAAAGTPRFAAYADAVLMPTALLCRAYCVFAVALQEIDVFIRTFGTAAQKNTYRNFELKPELFTGDKLAATLSGLLLKQTFGLWPGFTELYMLTTTDAGELVTAIFSEKNNRVLEGYADSFAFLPKERDQAKAYILDKALRVDVAAKDLDIKKPPQVWRVLPCTEAKFSGYVTLVPSKETTLLGSILKANDYNTDAKKDRNDWPNHIEVDFRQRTIGKIAVAQDARAHWEVLVSKNPTHGGAVLGLRNLHFGTVLEADPSKPSHDIRAVFSANAFDATRGTPQQMWRLQPLTRNAVKAARFNNKARTTGKKR